MCDDIKTGYRRVDLFNALLMIPLASYDASVRARDLAANAAKSPSVVRIRHGDVNRSSVCASVNAIGAWCSYRT